MSRLFHAALAAAVSIAAATLECHAQSDAEEDPDLIPPVVVEQVEPEKPTPKTKAVSVAKRPAKPHRPAPVPAPTVPATGAATPATDATQEVTGDDAIVAPGTRSGSLTVPTIAEARAGINQTPGGVALIPGTAYQESTPAVNLKDIVDFTPGVFAQTKWGPDTRLSIRGSGLSRNFHLRSVQLFMDGIPMNTSDGYRDFAEIDPTLYRYVEVIRGANALQYGANSLGGAINFVLPSGYTADRVDLPAGVIAAKPMPKPGWQIALTKGAYDRAYVFHGHDETEGVKAIVWSGGSLPEDYFDEFVFSAFIAGELDPETTLYFPVNQICAAGEMHWIETPAADGGRLERPAPALKLLAPEPHSNHHH